MTDENPRLIEKLNSVVVTVDELTEILNELDQRHDGGTAKDGDGMYLIVSMFADQPERAEAIYFRMKALAKIIEKRDAPGWTMPSHKSGALLTKRELIKAAATYPLSEIDGDIGFEIHGFLSKALEFAEAEGEA